MKHYNLARFILLVFQNRWKGQCASKEENTTGPLDTLQHGTLISPLMSLETEGCFFQIHTGPKMEGEGDCLFHADGGAWRIDVADFV